MAIELNVEQLMELAPDTPYRYNQVASMHPLWRSFLLDESERARLDIIRNNHRGDGTGNTYYTFMSSITGIEVGAIERFCVAGDGEDGVVTVIPYVTTGEFREFLDSKIRPDLQSI